MILQNAKEIEISKALYGQFRTVQLLMEALCQICRGENYSMDGSRRMFN